MKKIITISILSLIIFACSHKTASTVSATKPETPAEKTSSASVSNAQFLAGKTVYETKCGTCHKLKDPARGNIAQWTSWINRMAPKAKLTDEEKQQVTDYISVNALPN